MATLADSFLQDLEGLDSSDDLENEIEDGEPLDLSSVKTETGVKEEKKVVLRILEPVSDALAVYIASFQGGVRCAVTAFLHESSTMAVCQQARNALQKEEGDTEGEGDLLRKCSDLILEVDQEILNVHRFVTDLYGRQFPELASIVSGPVEYISIVKRARYELNYTQLDISDLVNNQVAVAVQVAASMCGGDVLSNTEMTKVVTACDEGLDLLDTRDMLLEYIETRMMLVCPNISNVIGRALGARLLTLGEGLRNLATMPSQNLMLLGAKKRSAIGQSSTSLALMQGTLYHSDIIQNTPLDYRNKALRLLSGKLSLAARCDLSGGDKAGNAGLAFRQQIIDSLRKSQAPPPPQLKRPLPKPTEGGGRTTKRGGRRVRRLKERRGQTALSKKANRTVFGVEPDIDEDEGNSD